MENKVFKAHKKMGEFKTFGEYIKEGRNNLNISKFTLAERIIDRGQYATEKDVTLWEKDAWYPDITIIYLLAEILEIHPNDLLKAKQLMQEAGLNSIDMLTMRVVCNFIDVSIWKIHQVNQVLFWVMLIICLAVAWGVNVPIIGPYIKSFLSAFAF